MEGFIVGYNDADVSVAAGVSDFEGRCGGAAGEGRLYQAPESGEHTDVDGALLRACGHG